MTFSAVAERFFLLFDGIVKYYKDLRRYLDELLEGGTSYMQETIDSVLEDEEGRQLLVEALTLHGVLLLLLEHRLPGSLREQLLVAHCRCRGSTDFLNFEGIQMLCRMLPMATPRTSSTLASVASFLQGSAKDSYSVLPNMLMLYKPEEMCARFPLPNRLMRVVQLNPSVSS